MVQEFKSSMVQEFTVMSEWLQATITFSISLYLL